MKNIIITVIIIFSFATANAQIISTTIDIDNGISFHNSITNAYYKDVQGFMTPFVGTWLYTNGNTSFKIVLTKYSMEYTGEFYIDYIAGEYQYIESGVEIRNTLSNTDSFKRGIWDCSLLLKSTSKPLCPTCSSSERRLAGAISDLDWDTHGSITFKLITVGGQPAIEAYIWGDVFNDLHHEMATPTGTFTFIKQ